MKAQIDGKVHCASNTAQYSPPAPAPEFDWVQPITTVPNPPAVTASDGANATAGWKATACPAGTSPVYEWRNRVTTNGFSGRWSAWTTWNAGTSAPVAMSQGAMLDVQAIARCVSPYTYDVAPAGVQPIRRTNGPASPAGSLSGWGRPIQAQAGVARIWHDAGGSSQPVDNRFLWSAVGCPANTWPEYSRALNSAWYGDWITGGIQDAAVVWGTTYVPTVQARCVSFYVQSVDSPPVNGPKWTTNVPTASGVWNSASPTTVYIGGNLWVAVGGGNCPVGTNAVYFTTDGAGHMYYGSFGDRWKNAGVKTYTSRAFCQGPDNRGADSAPATASVTINISPRPAPPLIVGSRWLRGASGGGSVTVSFNGVAGADSYQVEGDATDAWNTSYTSTRTVSGPATYTALAVCTTTVLVAGTGQVRAHTVGGWGDWASTGALAPQTGMSCH